MLSREPTPTAWGRLAWAASLPVCVAGWLIAHSLAYRLLASGSESSGALVERTGHGHLAFSPYLMAMSLMVLLLAVGAAVAAGAGRRKRPAVPLAPFAVLPLVDVICHVGLGSLGHGDEVSAGAVLEPIFLVGLAVQVPFALAVLLLTRTALAGAEGLGRGLTLRWRPRPRAPVSPARLRVLIATERRPVVPALASGYAERGPPASVAVR